MRLNQGTVGFLFIFGLLQTWFELFIYLCYMGWVGGGIWEERNKEIADILCVFNWLVKIEMSSQKLGSLSFQIFTGC